MRKVALVTGGAKGIGAAICEELAANGFDVVINYLTSEKEAEKLAEKYQMKKEDFLKEFGGIELVKYDLEVRKAIDLLKELNK